MPYYNNQYPYYQGNIGVPQQQPMYRPQGLQGKMVDSLDTVRASDFPLDGSISYFALTDGSAIVTKQLMLDGTSRTIIYKPAVNEPERQIKYLTNEDMQSFTEELNKLKKQFKSLRKELGKGDDDGSDTND